MPEEHDIHDASIPLLTDTLVLGNPLRARASAAVFAGAPVVTSAASGPAAAEDGLLAHDADALVERLRGRCLTWLTGDGRNVIEARCNAALQEHTHWLVGHVSREIGLALETELKGWVRDAVREELAARAGHPPAQS
ncbi:DUF2486 family protein [Paraburkholderia ferrariae]|uniref:DUF2486 family protein n=1 Tax=Paraburkholderia ferrariae TaxID=386056 RepID=UPI000487E30E|nr:DUF2486 family protein [Paraburkholderia ferrariae]